MSWQDGGRPEHRPWRAPPPLVGGHEGSILRFVVRAQRRARLADGATRFPPGLCPAVFALVVRLRQPEHGRSGGLFRRAARPLACTYSLRSGTLASSTLCHWILNYRNTQRNHR